MNSRLGALGAIGVFGAAVPARGRGERGSRDAISREAEEFIAPRLRTVGAVMTTLNAAGDPGSIEWLRDHPEPK